MYLYPKYITCDCNSSELICFRRLFPDSKIILCYFHIVSNCIIKLPEIRSKKDNIKKKALDLLGNIILILYHFLIIIILYFSLIIFAKVIINI